MRHRLAIPLALALTLTLVPGLAAPAAAGELAGVTMADTATVGGQPTMLNGMGLRKKLFIKVYVGGLYLPEKQASAEAVLAADAPRQMVMHFLYSVSKDQMCEAWDEGLADNTPNASAELKKSFATLCEWMEPIDKGHRAVFTYVPGEGTTVEVDGTTKGRLAGKAFADALLACWIGPEPGPGEDFKEAVLGG
jgi:hypothetical protein